MRITKKKKAFSLIELAIVIIVVGVLVIGIVAGKSLIDSAKQRNIESLNNSIFLKYVAGDRSDLLLWVESATKKSFIESEVSATTPNIGTWKNAKGVLIVTQKNATQTTASAKPLYVASAINGLPALRFDGGDFFSFDGSGVANKDYTMIIVEQRTSNKSWNTFFGVSGGWGTNNAIGISYSGASVIHSHYGNDYSASSGVGTYTIPIPRISVFTQSSISGKKYYRNGVLSGSSANTQPLLSNSFATIGQSFNSDFYVGDIGEVMVFNSELSDTERKEIERYLSNKWKIAVT